MYRFPRHTARTVATGLVLVSLAGLAAAQQLLPRLVVEPRVFDLGRMEQREVRQLSVTLRNDGQAPLHIQDVETSCGCTAATPDKRVLQPGESTNLAITFNSQRFEGPQLKTVSIHTDDPTNRVATVEIRVDVHAPIHVEPRPVMGFNRVPRGQTEVRKRVLSSGDVETLEVTPGKYRHDLFDVTVGPAPGGAANAREVTIALRPDAPVGIFREIITLRTNVPGAPTVDLEAGGEVAAPVMLQPEKVNLRYLQRGQEIRRVFHVRVLKGYDIKVTRAELDLPGFRVEGIQYVPASGEYLVTIFGRPVSSHDERAVKARGRMKGTLTIHTDSDEFPTLTASVMYLLRI